MTKKQSSEDTTSSHQLQTIFDVMGTPVEADRGDDGQLNDIMYEADVYNGNVRNKTHHYRLVSFLFIMI